MQQNDEEKMDDTPTGRKPSAIEWSPKRDRIRSDDSPIPFVNLDFAEIEKRVLATMISGKDDEQTCLVNRPGPALTFEMLEEMMADAERERQKQFEQEIEAYLLAGFKIVVNEFVPDGKLAILPKEYGDALERVLKRLRERNEAQQFVYRNFYSNPLFNPNCIS